jgi:hypothetical protein
MELIDHEKWYSTLTKDCAESQSQTRDPRSPQGKALPYSISFQVI